MDQFETLVGIGDAARFLDVPAHTLRFWEKEFQFYLNPQRTEGRQRRYDEDSIQRLSRIKYLLKSEGYSIAGAKRVLHLELRGVEGREPLVQSIYSLLQSELKTYIHPRTQIA